MVKAGGHPEVIGTHKFPTALGVCGLAWSGKGLTRFQLPCASEDQLAAALGPPGPAQVAPPDWVAQAVARVQGHLAGELDDLRSVPLDLRGVPPFTRKVYSCGRRVRPGRTVTYGELARKAGNPGATQAVGRAMATNPASLLMPCHRVLAANGGLGGFSAHGGTSTKLSMLTIEGADLAPVARAGGRALARQDPRLGRVIRRVGPFTLLNQLRRGDPLSVLVQAIVHQQVSMQAGATIFGRVCQAAGGTPDRISAEGVLGCGPQALRAAGLSRQKVSYVQDLARRTLDRSLPLEALPRMVDQAVIDALTEVKGIGRWSAEMYLMFHLDRLDVLPVGDLGLREGIKVLWGLEQRPTPREAAELGQGWAPFRSIATWYLWRMLEAGGV